mgnify:CR=1 FL=1
MKIRRFAVAAIVAGVVALSSGCLLGANDNSVQYTYEAVVVEPGDTLWSLVRRYNPDYEGDVRLLVRMASQRIGGASIMAGTVIEIPVAINN